MIQAEAQAIVTAARDEASRLAVEAGAALEALIVRRTKAVEEKIAQAEAQAIAEVRGRSADVAVEAARVLLTQHDFVTGRPKHTLKHLQDSVAVAASVAELAAAGGTGRRGTGAVRIASSG